MRKPATPPKRPRFEVIMKIWKHLIKKHINVEVTHNNEYLHWDELRSKQPRPAKISAEEWR
jgi:hypothetical protein